MVKLCALCPFAAGDMWPDACLHMTQFSLAATAQTGAGLSPSCGDDCTLASSPKNKQKEIYLLRLGVSLGVQNTVYSFLGFQKHAVASNSGTPTLAIRPKNNGRATCEDTSGKA